MAARPAGEAQRPAPTAGRTALGALPVSLAEPGQHIPRPRGRKSEQWRAPSYPPDGERAGLVAQGSLGLLATADAHDALIVRLSDL